MEIVSVRHKGLKGLLVRDDPKGLTPAHAERIRNMLTALVVAKNLDALESLTGWRVHRLGGDRMGTWSLSVLRNWRLTFLVDDARIFGVDPEDYH